MSFIDLATLTLHRRNEMETRINILIDKCSQAEKSLENIKMQARNLVGALNCSPSELKERFLQSMQKLDEYIYLVTDINLSLSALEDSQTCDQLPALQKRENPPSISPRPHLLDILSDPLPSTSQPIRNPYRLQEKTKLKRPKDDMLIAFSSNSCSEESMRDNRIRKKDPESHQALQKRPSTQNVQQQRLSSETPAPQVRSPTELAQQMSRMKVDVPEFAPPLRRQLEKWELPGQSVLQTDVVYGASIMHVEFSLMWVIADGLEDAQRLMQDMNEFYKDNEITLTREEVGSLPYCVFYDEESECFYRCLLYAEEDSTDVHVFLVDTGEDKTLPFNKVKPLARQFADKPPFARCCSLAGIDWTSKPERIDLFLKSFIGSACEIQIDDNSSEVLGVYLTVLPEKELLNQVVIDNGLAVLAERPKVEPTSFLRSVPSPNPVSLPPELVEGCLDITQCPEYEDPLEAVTGYHNRDEEEVCKHYKGGPEKTCFKGVNCKKRHVALHPDGWTLDKMEVTAIAKTLQLPKPGTLVQVRVTCVPHLNYVYVQFAETLVQEKKDIKRSFGVVLPPVNLDALVRDMNTAAGRSSLRPLKMSPAPGEFVAALYPPDNQWYRALVLSLAEYEQSIEVRYVDYGNELWIKENNVRMLDRLYTLLPVQAVKCKLAGVEPKSSEPEQWGRVKTALSDLVLDQYCEAKVIAREYDELEIELYRGEINVAEELVNRKLVLLKPYTVQDDTDLQHKLVPC